ncbi:MAG TPA: hypothetical protein VG754_09940 [Verrucomicrobiae bacterium]|nr:hypothetical protein [Verrucomicrobiae bacterium]
MTLWFVALKPTKEVFETMYLASVMDQANIAMRIRASQEMALVSNIESNFPQTVLAVHQAFRNNAGSTNALWMIKAYYQLNNIKVPEEIRGILDSLPEKPPTSCQMRLRELERQSKTNAPAAPAK